MCIRLSPFSSLMKMERFKVADYLDENEIIYISVVPSERTRSPFILTRTLISTLDSRASTTRCTNSE